MNFIVVRRVLGFLELSALAAFLLALNARAAESVASAPAQQQVPLGMPHLLLVISWIFIVWGGAKLLYSGQPTRLLSLGIVACWLGIWFLTGGIPTFLPRTYSVSDVCAWYSNAMLYVAIIEILLPPWPNTRFEF